MIARVRVWFPEGSVHEAAIAATGKDAPEYCDAEVTAQGDVIEHNARGIVQVPTQAPWQHIKDLMRAGYAVQLQDSRESRGE